MKILLLFLMISNATEITQPRVYAEKLKVKISATRVPVTMICKDDDSCTVSWNEDGDSLQSFYSKSWAVQTSIAEELSDIEARLDNGTATTADIRRAIKLILKLGGWAKK